MGTWYETCAISNLPIRYKDEAMIFYLKKNTHIFEEWAGAGEVDKWYTPIKLPFSAVCNIDEDFISNEKDVTEEINDIRRGDKEGYDIMFVLKPMYEAVISEMKERKYNKFLHMANEFIDNSKEKNVKEPFFMWDIEFAGNRFVDFFQKHNREMRPLLLELSNSNDPELKEKMIELVLFHYGLQILRKMWHPGFGRGSQDMEYSLHKQIAQLTIQKEEEIRKIWLEENLLDEEESEEDITKTHMWYI